MQIQIERRRNIDRARSKTKGSFLINKEKVVTHETEMRGDVDLISNLRQVVGQCWVQRALWAEDPLP